MPAAEGMSTFLKFLILIQAPRKYKALITNLTSNRGTVGTPSQGSYKLLYAFIDYTCSSGRAVLFIRPTRLTR